MNSPISVRDITAAEHLAWLRTQPSASFLQTPAWADVKKEWRSESVGWFEGEAMVGEAVELGGALHDPCCGAGTIAIVAVALIALLAWWWLGERFGWRTGVAIAVSFAGVLVLGFDPLVLQHPQSLLLMLVSAFFLAAGTVLMRPLKGLGMVSQQGWTAIIALLPLLALSAVFEPQGFAALRAASWIGWGGAAYSAIFASLFGHGLYYVLVQKHPVAQVTPWLLLSPVLAILLGIAVWGDRPGAQLWIGGAMVLGGVLLIALRALARTRPMPMAEEL